MPISLELTPASANRIGVSVKTAISPMGQEIISHLRAIDRNVQYYTDLFRPLPDEIAASVVNGVQLISVRVHETNQTMLDHIEAMRWAIAYLAYNTMADIWFLLGSMYYREGLILEAIRALHVDLVGIAYELTAIGNCVCSLLQAILDQLRAGIDLIGQITIVITGGDGGIFDFLKDIDLWKLLAFLAILAAFVTALGFAMNLFTANALIATVAIAVFVAAIMPLLDKLAGLDWSQIGKIATGLAALAGFVAGLGAALKLFTKDAVAAIPALNSLIDKLGDLAAKLAKLSLGEVGVMALALAALAAFVAGLAWALSLVSAQTLKALGPLSEFIDTLSRLAQTLTQFSAGGLVSLGVALAELVLFVAGLVWALSGLDVGILNALPSFTQLITTLQNLATAMAEMSAGELIAMGVAFALIAVFVWALAAALRYAEGPLRSVATILTETRKILEDIASFGESILDFLGSLGGGIGGLGGLLGPLGAGGLLPGLLPVLPDLLPTPFASQAAPAPAGPQVAAAPEPGPATGALVAAAPIAGAMPAAAVPQEVDQSVNVEGGITVNVNAERLEADAAELLSDRIIAQLQARLGALRAEQDFRLGARPEAVG
jgi:hypothetical protein